MDNFNCFVAKLKIAVKSFVGELHDSFIASCILQIVRDLRRSVKRFKYFHFIIVYSTIQQCIKSTDDSQDFV